MHFYASVCGHAYTKKAGQNQAQGPIVQIHTGIARQRSTVLFSLSLSLAIFLSLSLVPCLYTHIYIRAQTFIARCE